MQSLMLFVMILALATIAIGIALALQYDTKEAFVFMLIAGVMIAAVYYVAKTSNMIVIPDAVPVGLWSLALVPLKSNVRSVETKTVIVVRSKFGAGVESDPVREITQYYSLEGELLSTVDTWMQEREKGGE